MVCFCIQGVQNEIQIQFKTQMMLCYVYFLCAGFPPVFQIIRTGVLTKLSSYFTAHKSLQFDQRARASSKEYLKACLISQAISLLLCLFARHKNKMPVIRRYQH
jgi:hypothetical protein